MKEKKTVLEQHIAIFGSSGSGKTVLVSSFYGATQEATFLKNSLYRVVADNIGQGAKLNRNYLGMREESVTPLQTRHSSHSYSFSVKLKNLPNKKSTKQLPFDALKVVWHDYPGEWFETQPSSEAEAHRRVDTFRALLESDVALLLIDGQRLVDHSGEEERYLKSQFTDFRNGLSSLRDEILDEGAPLVQFPRIWIIALSKADLLPEMNSIKFRDMLHLKAADDIEELRSVISDFVETPEALSVGEDFLLLSSAKFEPESIKVNDRIGLDLILPVAAMVPLERHAKWAKLQQLPTQVAASILDGGTKLLASALLGKAKPIGPLGFALSLISSDAVVEAAQLAGSSLREVNAQALKKENHVTAILTQFQLDLEQGEEDSVFLRSIQ